MTGTGSWVGWDIARSIVLRAHGVSGYVLDSFGGHPGPGVATVIAGVPGIDHPVTVDVYRNVTKL